MCDLTCKVKVTWQVCWPILGIHALHLPIQVHTQPWTHTPWTHTPWTHTRSSGQPFMHAASGEQLEIWCLAQGHLVVVLRVERAQYIHSPHRCRERHMFCAYDLPESDRRSAKATANGKRCNISPVHRSPSHALRREVLWGKRCSPAEGHWDVCSLTYVFWFSINWRENGSLRRVQWGRLIWRRTPSKTQFFVFRRHKKQKTEQVYAVQHLQVL